MGGWGLRQGWVRGWGAGGEAQDQPCGVLAEGGTRRVGGHRNAVCVPAALGTGVTCGDSRGHGG